MSSVETQRRSADGQPARRPRASGYDRAVPPHGRSGLPGKGLLKGLGVTLKTMLRPAVTQQYPHTKPDLHPRTRGVIALMEENCTVCMLCSRECPDWCIYIESHKETTPPAKEGGRARTRNVLDRFAIDFALCMYCGICIEVCPFDALFWSPEFEYSTYRIAELTHEQDRLRAWMDTVPAPPPLEEGAESPAEIQSALELASKRRAQAVETAVEAQAAGEVQPAAAAAAAPAGTQVPTAGQPEIEVEAGEIDQETYDQLIAEGKSERVARARAKAAYVRKRKAELRAQMGSEVAAPAEAPPVATPPAQPPLAGAPEEKAPPVAAEPEIEIEAGEIDQETYDQFIAEGKSERVARAKAKAAYVRKARASARGDAAAGGGRAGQLPPSEGG